MSDGDLMYHDDFVEKFGLSLWGEFGEQNELDTRDEMIDVTQLLAEGRIVTLYYGPEDCAPTCTEDEHDELNCPYLNEDSMVRLGWGTVNVARRVVMPAGWRA